MRFEIGGMLWPVGGANRRAVVFVFLIDDVEHDLSCRVGAVPTRSRSADGFAHPAVGHHLRRPAMFPAVSPVIAIAVIAATAATDAAYVFFNAAVGARRRLWAANWSAIW